MIKAAGRLIASIFLAMLVYVFVAVVMMQIPLTPQPPEQNELVELEWLRGDIELVHLKAFASVAFAVTLFLNVTKRRFQCILSLALAVMALIAFAMWWPRSWELTASAGSESCLIAIGNCRNQVVGACGPPRGTGEQPKRLGRSIFDWTTICSAPCEARGDLLLFYDCETKLSEVTTRNADDHQGCVFSAPFQDGKQP